MRREGAERRAGEGAARAPEATAGGWDRDKGLLALLLIPPTAGREGTSMCCLTQVNCNFVQTKKIKGRRGDIRYPLDTETVRLLGAVVYKRQRRKKGQSSSLLLWVVTH